LTEVIINSANSHIPRKSVNFTKCFPVPWWNVACDEAIYNRNKARDKISKSRLPQDFVEYKRLQAKARFVIKSAKKQHWANFCDKLNIQTKPKTVWRTIKCMSASSTNFSIPALEYNNSNFIMEKETFDI
jgi:hypothetical protein